MRNLSRKTKKKIMKILRSDHFEDNPSEVYNGLHYWPSENSPLSAIWHHIRVTNNGDIFGYMMDDHCCYCVAGSVIRRKVLHHITSPMQLFYPHPRTVRQAKQIVYRLKKMGRQDMSATYWMDVVLLSIMLGVDSDD